MVKFYCVMHLRDKHEGNQYAGMLVNKPKRKELNKNGRKDKEIITIYVQ